MIIPDFDASHNLDITRLIVLLVFIILMEMKK